MGTRVRAILLRVIDGDTFLVKVGDSLETIRLLYVDCEESRGKLNGRPPTNAGRLAYEFALAYWWGQQPVIEFASADSLEKCLVENRDYFGRLLVYMWKESENYNLRLIQLGLSPYFTKYGSSIYYNQEFLLATEQAQNKILGIWNPAIDFEQKGSPKYINLIPFWNKRAESIDAYRLQTDSIFINALSNCDNLCSLIRQARFMIKEKSIIKERNNIFYIYCDIRYVRKKFSHCFIYRVGLRSSYLTLNCESDSLNEFILRSLASNGYLYIAGLPSIYRGQEQLNIIAVSDRYFPPINSIDTNVLPSIKRREEAIAYIREKVRKLKNDSRN
jgi:endonuclease YncB( thermonuclease family)